MEAKTGIDKRRISSFLIAAGYRVKSMSKKKNIGPSKADNRALIDIIIDGDFTKQQKIKLIANLL